MNAASLRRRTLLGGGIAALGLGTLGRAQATDRGWLPWRPGLLDIHHINTGRGNATFVVTPDGRTLLIDAGELDADAFHRFAPLELGPERPHAGAGAGRSIARYIARHMPPGMAPRIDDAVLTHYHDDHVGAPHAGAPLAPDGSYRLTGIAAVATALPIGRLLDRGEEGGVAQAPKDATFANYTAFARDAFRRGTMRETLRAGSIAQITPGPSSSFSVRVVKSGRWVWTGSGDTAAPAIPAEALKQAGPGAENALSAALLLSYGRFRYFSGGDNGGLGAPERPGWQDVESPLAAAVGQVEAMALNHHGNRDANHMALLTRLAPRVVVQQCWTSDQPGQEVVHRLAGLQPRPIVLATQSFASTQAAIGPAMRRLFRPETGHVVLRVEANGAYDIAVLDDQGAADRVLWQGRRAC